MLGNASDFYFSFDGVGDQTLFMSEMVETFLVGRSWQFRSAVGYLRMESHQVNPWDAMLVFGHGTDRIVLIAINDEAFAGRQPHIRQHVTTRQRSHKSLLRIDGVRIRIRRWNNGWRRGGEHSDAAVKRPCVFAGVFAFEKIGTGSFP